MEDCIFCKIVEKNLQGENIVNKVYEDDNFLGFLDIKPINPGHCLLIPKKHFRWVDDVDDFGKYFEAAKKIGLSIKKSLSPMAVCYVTLGFEVPHAHIRIIPRFENDGHLDGLNFKLYKQISEEKMKEIAESIRNAA
jgi:histidine triad (HIT) family protein